MTLDNSILMARLLTAYCLLLFLRLNSECCSLAEPHHILWSVRVRGSRDRPAAPTAVRSMLAKRPLFFASLPEIRRAVFDRGARALVVRAQCRVARGLARGQA